MSMSKPTAKERHLERTVSSAALAATFEGIVTSWRDGIVRLNAKQYEQYAAFAPLFPRPPGHPNRRTRRANLRSKK